VTDIGISVREAARRIGCDPSRVRKLLKGGQLRGYRDGRRIRVRESSVVDYQERAPIPSAPPIGKEPLSPHRRNWNRQREALAALEQLGVKSSR
jgi:excisionase family DNA binding protein